MSPSEPYRDPAAGSANAPAPSPRVPGRGERIAVKLVIPLILVLLVPVTLMWVVFTTAVVVGDSMLPTLEHGEYMLVTKGYNVPVRGDIVSFREPGPGGTQIEVLKRVVGAAGDTVEVANGRAIVNGRPEAAHTGVFQGSTVFGPVTVPEGTVFVLGDNRPVSLDSRRRGPIPISLIKGRAVAVFLPLWRVRLLGR